MEAESSDIVPKVKSFAEGGYIGRCVNGHTLIIASTISVACESSLVPIGVGVLAHDTEPIVISFESTGCGFHGGYGVGLRIQYLVIGYMPVLTVSVHAIMCELDIP